MSACVEAKDPRVHAGFGELLKLRDCPRVDLGFFDLCFFS